MVDGKRLGDFSLPSLPQKIQDLPDHLRKTIGLMSFSLLKWENLYVLLKLKNQLLLCQA
jgi:hypothetical protein